MSYSNFLDQAFKRMTVGICSCTCANSLTSCVQVKVRRLADGTTVREGPQSRIDSGDSKEDDFDSYYELASLEDTINWEESDKVQQLDRKSTRLNSSHT